MNTLTRRIFSTLALGSAATLLASCGGGGDDGSSKTKLAFVTNMSADFWTYAEAGAQKASAELGDVEVEFMVGNGDPSKQREICEALLVRGVKGIAISPNNPQGQQDMINDWAKKSAVIAVDSDAPESDRLFYMGTDNVAAGRQAGELLKEALPNGGKVMAFVGIGDQQNAVERYRGLKEAVAGTQIEILDLRTDGGDMSRARSNAEDTLTRHPDIAGMVGLFAYNAPAILEAVRAKGATGKIQIVAFDEDPRTLKAIDAGEIHGTVVQQPFEFGYQSIKALHGIVVGKKAASDLGVPDTKQLFIDTQQIRKGGGAAYLEQCEAWKASLKK